MASKNWLQLAYITRWGRETHIYVAKLGHIISSNNNILSPHLRQAIIWANAWLSSIGPMRTYFSEIWINLQQFSMKKMHMKMSSAKWQPSCLGLNVLTAEELCSTTLKPTQCIHIENESLFLWISIKYQCEWNFQRYFYFISKFCIWLMLTIMDSDITILLGKHHCW